MSRSFSQQLDAELQAVASQVNKAMEDTAIEGLGFVTSRSAVDTGRYRAGWNLSVDRPLALTPALKKTGKAHRKGQDIYGLRPQHILFDITRNNSVIVSNSVDEYNEKVDALYGDVAATREVMRSGIRRRLKAVK